MKKFILIVILVLITQNTLAVVLFEDNFDSQNNWQSNQQGSSGGDLTWPATGAVSDGGSCTTNCPPTGWTYYGAARSYWADRGNDTYIIDNTPGRGGSGKCVQYWHEDTGNWAGGNGPSKWVDSSGATEVYVQYWLKYQSGFSWSDGTGHAQQKLMRISSYGTNVDPSIETGSFDDYGSNGWHSPVSYPDFYYNYAYGYAYLFISHRLSPDVIPWNDTGYTSAQWSNDGDWHCYTFRAKLNSAPGVADGEEEGWIDGVSKYSRNDVPWVQSEPWQSNHDYSTGILSVIIPTASMIGYRVITDNGSSGSVEPNWLVDCPNLGDTCSDGDLMWENFTNYTWNKFDLIDNWYTTFDPILEQEQVLYMDDVVISTDYKGPTYVIGNTSVSTTISSSGTPTTISPTGASVTIGD